VRKGAAHVIKLFEAAAGVTAHVSLVAFVGLD
jgi:hypothetical protein